MATVILVRHGRSTSNSAGTLAGRLSGVELDETGHRQVLAVSDRLAQVPLRALYSSPLTRCRQTAAAIADRHPGLSVAPLDSITECDYGDWQGGSIKELAKEPLWRVVQRQPSAATFPGGESMLAMQARMVAAIRGTDAAIEAEHGAHAVWVAVSHGDPIKSVVADALGMHLDQFQRIQVDPASLTIIRYTAERPYLLAANTHGGDLGWLAAEHPSAVVEGEPGAVLGGGAGPDLTPAGT